MMSSKLSKIEKDAEEKDIYVQKPTVITSEFIAEEIWNRKDLPQYLVYRFKEDTFETFKEIPSGETNAKGQNIIYVPVYNDSLKKGLVITPSGRTEVTFRDVFEEIDKFALSSYDPCGQDALVKLLTRICVGSWFLDRFVADPIYDIAGSGKICSNHSYSWTESKRQEPLSLCPETAKLQAILRNVHLQNPQPLSTIGLMAGNARA